ncbi:uncharacterized protein LOC102709933 [Oryza brachyantha]|uniref:Uncharacterized protein n=1 Tax=Oryza brachyantha TaxID=4533 RepID=J3MAU5_ORYBR|nr:uncharacterized protein LOC102709933 [Oryza brachyantha]
MGACATKPKTLEAGKAPEEATPIETPKVAVETTSSIKVVVVQAPEKVVEEAKVELVIADPPTNIDTQKVEATPKVNKEAKVEEEVKDKIIEEEKPSAPIKEKNAEVNNTEVVEETIEVNNTEVSKGATEVKNVEEEKPIQS